MYLSNIIFFIILILFIKKSYKVKWYISYIFDFHFYIYYFSGSLDLSPYYKLKVKKKERTDFLKLSTLLKETGDGNQENIQRSVDNFEKAQAYSVDVNHADCEEMIGEVCCCF